MTRLSYIDPAASEPQLTAVFGIISRTCGEVTNLCRVVANQPTMLDRFFGVSHDAGMAPDEIATIESGDTEPFSVPEQVGINYARQFARCRDVDDATFAEFRKLSAARQLIELTVTVAWYHLTAAIVGTLQVEVKSLKRLADTGMEET